MVNSEIVDYINSSMKRGFSWNEIYQQLLTMGHPDYEISAAVEYMNKTQTELPKEEVVDNRNFNVKWFLIGLIGLIFIAILFVVFGNIFRGAETKILYVDETAISAGTLFNIQNGLMLDLGFSGQVVRYTVFMNENNLDLKGIGREINLVSQEKKEIDLNLDGVSDVYMTYNSAEKSVAIKTICFENWVCSEWSECLSGIKKRVCTDKNVCETMENRPEVEISC